MAGSLPIAPEADRRGKHANIGGAHSRVAGPIERTVIVFVSIVRYLSASMVAHWLPRSRSGLVFLSGVFGFVAPVCDCGVIPVARRLIAKGVPLYATTTFILVAPVVNPVVLLSTAFAFQEGWRVVGLRMAMTLSVVITVGLLASRIAGGRHAGALQPTVVIPIEGGSDTRPISAAEVRSPGPGLFGHATAEFVDVMFFVVLGALFTAAIQTFVPRGDLTALGDTRVASVLMLMPVATLLSISNRLGRPGSGGACTWRARSCMTTASSDASSRCPGTPSSTVWPMRAPSCWSSSRRETRPLPQIHGSRWRVCSRAGTTGAVGWSRSLPTASYP